MAGDVRARKIILEMVEKIIREYHPKKLILFGSYAKGKPTEDSDLDILIVTETRMPSEEIYRMRRELLRDFSIPVQLICVTDEEFLETKDIIGGIAYPASKYGEVIYEKS